MNEDFRTFRKRVLEIEGGKKLMPTAEETPKIKVGATFEYSPQLSDSDDAQHLQM
jgi:hypothetical protein